MLQHKHQRTRQVVIVDDEALIRLDLRGRLTELGYLVVGEAADGQHALEVVRATEPDLVIMDIKMPGLDGLSAARQLAAGEGTPVVLLSGYSEPALIDSAREAGVLDYLVKPISDGRLQAALELALTWAALHRGLRTQNAALQRTVAERPLVEQATKVLMDREALSEEDAFRQLRQLSMRSRKPLAEVAQAVLLALQE